MANLTAELLDIGQKINQKDDLGEVYKLIFEAKKNAMTLLLCLTKERRRR